MVSGGARQIFKRMATQVDMTLEYKVAEIFGPTIQGEGPEVGMPCYFVRFGGCDFLCAWCDSLHAVLTEKVRALPSMDSAQIHERLGALPKGARWVVLSGGNPALWDLMPLIMRLRLDEDRDWRIAVETQGTVWKDWMGVVDRVVVSPKPPSSHMPYKQTLLEGFISNLERRKTPYALKFVVFDFEDLGFAYDVTHDLKRLMSPMDIFVSVGTKGNDTTDDLLARTRQVSNWVTTYTPKDISARVLPQLHVLMHGHMLGV